MWRKPFRIGSWGPNRSFALKASTRFFRFAGRQLATLVHSAPVDPRSFPATCLSDWT
jgi:hypothetical protein